LLIPIASEDTRFLYWDKRYQETDDSKIYHRCKARNDYFTTGCDVDTSHKYMLQDYFDTFNRGECVGK
jgi:hypothetical protein